MSQLEIKGISKTYKQRQVVRSISFSVSSGQVVGLLGPNGAGKTTSFYMVVGLVTPDQGQVSVDEQEIGQMPMYERSRYGLSYLPQEASIFRKLTVEENILVALEAAGLTGNEKTSRLNKLLSDFSIEHIKENYGYSLSGGERRRVEIARSLGREPRFLLLDEPFAGIDPIAVGEIQGIITKLREKNIGILITDHNVRETLGICDYAYILKEGKIEVEGTSDEIAASPTARKFYLGENFTL
ncbi:MAG: LPS export ABC transporter ATP-binding protein [Bdellovibrionaceae bacterium]|jgi:lipopolysaccharide export system ATP-binding protein|nr:LPS export ABC transporter ATP-binding protein [Pseudobdellovibrionaceae bacterium]